jgi:hypothetical protein
MHHTLCLVYYNPMTFHSLLTPALIYAGGSILLYMIRPLMGEKTRRLGGLLVTVLAFLAVVWLLPSGDILPERWTLSNWGDPDGVGRGLEFRLDTLSATYLLLTAVVGMAVFAGSLDAKDDPDTPDYQPGLLGLLAGISIMVLADNMRTWLMAGLVLDIGLLFSIGFAGRARWFLVLVLHSLVTQGALIFATLALAGASNSTALDPSNQPAIYWTLIAAVARLAPLPFCLFPIAFEKIPQRVLGILPLATLGVGSLLLARVIQAAEFGPQSDYAALGTIAALGVALGGWVAWRRQEPSVRLMILTTTQSAWVLWAFAWGATDVAIRTAIFGVLALSALAVHGGRVDFRHGVQLPMMLAIASLAAFPGSALWNTVTTLSGEAWWRDISQSPTTGLSLAYLIRPAAWLTVAAAIGMMGTIAALLHWLVNEGEDEYQPSRWVGVTVLAFLSIPFVGELFGLRVNPLPGAPLSTTPLPAQWVLPIIGWTGGLWLWRVRRTIHSLRPLLDSTASFFSFAWLYRILGRVGWLLFSGVRGIVLLIEGENYGWLLLFLFVTLLVLVRP